MKLFSHYLIARTISVFPPDTLPLYLSREPGYRIDGLFWNLLHGKAARMKRDVALIIYRRLQDRMPVKLVRRWWWFGWHEEVVHTQETDEFYRDIVNKGA